MNEQYGDARALCTRIAIQEAYSTNPESWFRWLFDRLVLQPQSRLLELGCGPGDLWLENLGRLPQGVGIILSDLSLGMLQEARGSLSRRSPHFSFSVIDVQTIPIGEGVVDAVIGNGLLDHVPDRVRALDEIKRVLKPSGVFYTTTGSRSHLRELEALVERFVPDADYGGSPARFGLENGAKLLSPWFGEIRRYLYKDRLVFPESEPVLAYVLSERSVQRELVGEKLDGFRQFLEEKLAAEGTIEVTTEKVLFCARDGG